MTCCTEGLEEEVKTHGGRGPADGGVLPVDMKKGMRNLPLRTRARRFCRVLPSNGRAPHTNTYNTTPKLCGGREDGRNKRMKRTSAMQSGAVWSIIRFYI